MDVRDDSGDFVVNQDHLNNVLDEPLRRLFIEAIAVNPTAFEDSDADTGKLEFVGSKIETALLHFVKDHRWADYHKTHKQVDVVQIILFASEQKAMGIVIKLPNKKWHFYVKGALEVLTKKCTSHVVVRNPGIHRDQEGDSEIKTKIIDKHTWNTILGNITFYVN